MLTQVTQLLEDKNIKFTTEIQDNGTLVKASNFTVLVGTNIIVKFGERTVIIFGSDENYLQELKSILELE